MRCGVIAKLSNEIVGAIDSRSLRYMNDRDFRSAHGKFFRESITRALYFGVRFCVAVECDIDLPLCPGNKIEIRRRACFYLMPAAGKKLISSLALPAPASAGGYKDNFLGLPLRKRRE